MLGTPVTSARPDARFPRQQGGGRRQRTGGDGRLEGGGGALIGNVSRPRQIFGPLCERSSSAFSQ